MHVFKPLITNGLESPFQGEPVGEGEGGEIWVELGKVGRSRSTRVFVLRTPNFSQTSTLLGKLPIAWTFGTGEFRQRVAKEVEHLYRGEYWVKQFEVITTDDR